MSKPWQPRPYQLEALEFALSRYGSGLMLDPGLGKTSTFLALIDTLRSRGDVKRVLVCAPLRVAQTVWPAEAQKWDDFKHLKVCDLTEKSEEYREWARQQDFDVYVINPESLYKIINPQQLTGASAHKLENYWNLDMFIADESTRFADPSTKRFKALKPFLPMIERRNVATGTCAPNGEHQLFGQCYILDFGAALGAYITHFRQMYMHPHPYIAYTYEMNVGAADRIYERVGHLLLRMRARDHLDMPELVHNRLYAKLPPVVRKQYDNFERDRLIALADETIPAFSKASLRIKCHQVSNGFIYSREEPGKAHRIHSVKLDLLETLIEEMQGRPLLLMYEFIEDSAAIAERFPFAVNLSGAKNAAKIIEDFNVGKIRLLIAHPRSAGHGLNLQESCSDICWFGVNEDLELWIQAIARVWRQGQPSPVVKNHILMIEDTLDDVAVDNLTVKEARQDKLDQALISYAKRKVG